MRNLDKNTIVPHVEVLLDFSWRSERVFLRVEITAMGLSTVRITVSYQIRMKGMEKF